MSNFSIKCVRHLVYISASLSMYIPPCLVIGMKITILMLIQYGQLLIMVSDLCTCRYLKVDIVLHVNVEIKSFEQTSVSYTNHKACPLCHIHQAKLYTYMMKVLHTVYMTVILICRFGKFV